MTATDPRQRRNSGKQRTGTGGLTFRALNAGREHTCGITTDGRAFCWGWNYEGQLGNGTTDNSTVPTPGLGS